MAVICKTDKEAMEFMRDLCRSIFLDSQSYAFAVALHRSLSWPIFGLKLNGKIRHVFLHPVNVDSGVFFDARGYIAKQKLIDTFSFGQPCELGEIEEKDLSSKGPILDNSIDNARQFAEIIWPNLPWKRSTRTDKILEFVKELEVLSQRHGLWIRGAFPGIPPILAEGCGDESYSLKIMADGYTYSVNRIIDQS